MKRELTIEQSRTLIERGVPAEKASVSKMQGLVFDFCDLLELLPKEIHMEDEYTYKLDIGFCYADYCYYHYEDRYQLNRNNESDELIDCLFKLLIWVIDNEHIKFEKS